RLAHNETLRPANAGQGSELGITALDELAKERRVQPSACSSCPGRLELAPVAGERLALALVVVSNADEERGRRAVIDEVVTKPLGLPRLPLSSVAPQSGVE